MKPRFVLRSAYDYDPDQASLEAGLSIDPAEMVTQPQFAEDADINTIVRRFGVTGELPNGVAMPRSGDFSDAVDFHQAMNLVRQAEDAFLAVPAETRARFQHDPGALIAFLEDPANREEAISLGLIPKPVEVARDGSLVPPAT